MHFKSIYCNSNFLKQNQYDHHKQLRAAQGVKIEAKELEKCIAGLNLLVANHPDEVEICKEEIEERLSTVMNSFKTKDRGVFVQASTLGSLEALLAFLKDSKIPVSIVCTNHKWGTVQIRKFNNKTLADNSRV